MSDTHSGCIQTQRWCRNQRCTTRRDGPANKMCAPRAQRELWECNETRQRGRDNKASVRHAHNETKQTQWLLCDLCRTFQTSQMGTVCVAPGPESRTFSRCNVSMGSVLQSSSPNCGMRFRDSLIPSTPMSSEILKATLILLAGHKCNFCSALNVGNVELPPGRRRLYGIGNRIGSLRTRHNQEGKRVIEQNRVQPTVESRCKCRAQYS